MTRHTDHERHTSRLFPKCHLVPVLLLAEMPAVIAPQDDNGFIPEDEPVEFVQHFADLGVDPYRYPERRPGLETSFRRHLNARSNVDLERRERLVEYNGSRDNNLVDLNWSD